MAEDQGQILAEDERKTNGAKGTRCTMNLRERKERKTYTDDWNLGEDEMEGIPGLRLDLKEKLRPEKYTKRFIKEMQGKDFNLEYVQKYGLQYPLLFRDTKDLQMQVPSKSFTINDVRICVGSRRMLDVMDVNTQKNTEMSMKDWQKYYESPNKDRLLNVISLEFSKTKLENFVKAPLVVRQLDWADRVWPRHLKDLQTESTNVLDEMMYPKVQKYCLMSVKGCYTDFHIDFGGTSVWYHVLKGSKVFWLIPPIKENLDLYEKWVMSGKQSDTFFGDQVEECGMIRLEPGMTFFIPTGWIHAVYTFDDSLVFGGNFLHSYGIELQLKIALVEEATHVPQKFRYPFFTEMLWYVLERYVHCVLGVTHLNVPQEYASPLIKLEQHVYLTPWELLGIKLIVVHLHNLPTTKKNVPELIKDPVELIQNIRVLVEKHRYDRHAYAVTGKMILRWPGEDVNKMKNENSPLAPTMRSPPAIVPATSTTSTVVKDLSATFSQTKQMRRNPLPPGATRRRRVRCKLCQACVQDDCGECTHCKDMVKYGGFGKLKQTCIRRQCLQPSLPQSAVCKVCNLDGWNRDLDKIASNVIKKYPNNSSSLMECSLCYEIMHKNCSTKAFGAFQGVVNEDLPSSWECPGCTREGRNIDPQILARAKNRYKKAKEQGFSSESDSEPTSPSIKRENESDLEANSKKKKLCHPLPDTEVKEEKPDPSMECSSEDSSAIAAASS